MAEFLSIDDKSLRQFRQALARASGDAEKYIFLGLNMMSSFLASKARSYAPVGATGHLKSSLSHAVFKRVSGEHEGYVLVVPPGSRYVWYADRGRSPGRRPPLDPIYLWVKRKLHPGVQVRAGRFRRLVSVEERETLTRGIAFAIMNKIARKGTKGSRFIEKTLSDPESKEKIKKVVDWILKKIAEDVK